ncbi:hypothetical protein DYL72_15805 [Vibrio anguillarum]|uniref:Uncharacterized protein n=1 Tax=Vibrio anguillarum TaxID=55601 RepID=A0A7U6FS76_VIBAN|nr:hypothetical protein [Vibrio anguillarum]AZS26369.1 hypothetical protein DYL72_15805 [Vibrio anguillarum]
MAEYGELSPSEIGRECTLKPTQGAYQKRKSGVVVDETKTLLKVRVEGEIYYWKFSKQDMHRTGLDKNRFPRYTLSFTDEG